MNKIVLWSLCAAFAGFLFGFDTVVISGAEKQLQQIWQSSDAFHGTYVIGIALWGTVAVALFGGFPANFFRRKKKLIFYRNPIYDLCTEVCFSGRSLHLRNF